MKLQSHYLLLFVLPLVSGLALAQDPAHATEFRMKNPGKGPGGEIGRAHV